MDNSFDMDMARSLNCERLQLNDITTNLSSETEKELNIFLENCSLLYNLILDTLHNLTTETISCKCLEEMASTLNNSAIDLLEECPDASSTVILRLKTICCAMEQLKIQQNDIYANQSEADSESSMNTDNSNIIIEMRSWLQQKEQQLEQNNNILKTGSNISILLLDQQRLQLEIQRDGQLLVNSLVKDSNSSSKVVYDEKKRKEATNIEVFRKRWHTLYLDSLLLLCKIEEFLKKQTEQSASDSESDPDNLPPPLKRARIHLTPTHNKKSSAYSSLSDQCCESECESTMNDRTETPSSSLVMDEIPAVTKWDSVQQDIGYSSGENSQHDVKMQQPMKNTKNGSEMKAKRIECSPVKAYYQTTQLDEFSDLEIAKAINHEVTDDELVLSDSMLVNHDLTIESAAKYSDEPMKEFDEVMALYNNGNNAMTESFNTKWREICGMKRSPRKFLSRENSELGTKSSRDASSEESSGSDCDHLNNESPEKLMTIWSNTENFVTSSPLKRQRSSRGVRLMTESLFDDSLEMDQSFCSTKSELPPCKTRWMNRRKLRVRRLNRCMSDGEQLNVFSSKHNGLLTPEVRVSPPSIQNESMKLLCNLHAQLTSEAESDVQHEHSDVETFEWDEYNPPNKDETIVDSNESGDDIANLSQKFCNIDDDFNEHFGSHYTIRFIDYCTMNLNIAKENMDSINVNSAQAKNMDKIARKHLKEIGHVLTSKPSSYRLSQLELDTLKSLRAEWEDVQEKMCNPIGWISTNISKWANKLNDMAMVSEGIEIGSINDVAKAVDLVSMIEKRLNCEKEQLNNIIFTQTFGQIDQNTSMAFNVVMESYEEAAKKISAFVKTLERVKTDWEAFTSQGNEIKNMMADIESKLNKGMNSNIISDDINLCQERMDSLETKCNYLTDSLRNLYRNNLKQKDMPNVSADLSIYTNALAKLRDRCNEVINESIMDLHPQEPQHRVNCETPVFNCTNESTETFDDVTEAVSIQETVQETVSSSKLIQVLFILSILTAIAAILYYYLMTNSFGPHLTYVNGPPPM